VGHVVLYERLSDHTHRMIAGVEGHLRRDGDDRTTLS